MNAFLLFLSRTQSASTAAQDNRKQKTRPRRWMARLVSLLKFMTYQPDKPIVCENCNHELEGVAADYVIPKIKGVASYAEDQCEYCDWEFSAQTNTDGTIDVESLG
jgi:uncharacterized protein with PIN domain